MRGVVERLLAREDEGVDGGASPEGPSGLGAARAGNDVPPTASTTARAQGSSRRFWLREQRRPFVANRGTVPQRLILPQGVVVLLVGRPNHVQILGEVFEVPRKSVEVEG